MHVFFFFYMFPQVSGRLSLDSEVFGNFGNLYTAAAITAKSDDCSSRKSRALYGLDRALKNMDNIKETYSEKLHVDPYRRNKVAYLQIRYTVDAIKCS